MDKQSTRDTNLELDIMNVFGSGVSIFKLQDIINSNYNLYWFIAGILQNDKSYIKNEHLEQFKNTIKIVEGCEKDFSRIQESINEINKLKELMTNMSLTIKSYLNNRDIMDKENLLIILDSIETKLDTYVKS